MDAAARLKAPRPEQHLPRVLTRGQMSGIFEGLAARSEGDYPVALRDQAIVELLYASAMRVSELTGLRLGDIDLIAADRASPGQGRQGAGGPIRRTGGPRVGSVPGRGSARSAGERGDRLRPRHPVRW